MFPKCEKKIVSKHKSHMKKRAENLSTLRFRSSEILALEIGFFFSFGKTGGLSLSGPKLTPTRETSHPKGNFRLWLRK